MPAKILLPPVGKHGSAIIGEHGRLRIVDPPKRCRGYQSGCNCKRCLKREALKLKRPNVTTCECDRPLSSDGSCFKCGRPIAKSLEPAA